MRVKNLTYYRSLLQCKIECFFLIDFQFLTIMNLGTHLGPLSYKRTTWLVIFVIYLYINSKINIIILDILSHISNQLHSLIWYHFKYIHSTPQLQHNFPICLRYLPIPIFSLSCPIYPNYNPNITPYIFPTSPLMYP